MMGGQDNGKPAAFEAPPAAPQPGFQPPGFRPPHSGTAQPQRRGWLLPVLLAVTVTFVFSSVVFYTLYARGVLAPAFARTAADPDADLIGNGIRISVEGDDADAQQAAAKLLAALEALDDNFYVELSDADLLNALAVGVASGIDNPYTYYLSKDELESMNESMSGSYAGIGATVTMNRGGFIEVLEVVPDGPADKAGVQAGDIPIIVDGENVEEYQDVSALAALVKGPEGTDVAISFYRPSEQRQIDMVITRAIIQTEAVSHRMLTRQIGYLRITQFLDARALVPQFTAAVDHLLGQGAKRIVFDLRNNPGGDAAAVIGALDYLLPEGEIARIRGRADGRPDEEVWRSDAQMAVPKEMHYAILLNENSASASELFAGCLHDWEKAVLIGQQTYGKGSGTRYFMLPDGSAINVTVFRYYLPSGDSVEGDGLEPDFVVSLSEEASYKPLVQLTEEEDTQLAAAIDYLEGRTPKTDSDNASSADSGNEATDSTTP
ncbi:MAG: S41 family peptidase [Bacillota bacterium]|nr:S41 family peptidase [Bacillota bacterium]